MKTKSKKEVLIAALVKRHANQPEHINNADLYAGSNMYFYCKHCGCGTDVLPELYKCVPKTICYDCKTLVENGWMDEAKKETNAKVS